MVNNSTNINKTINYLYTKKKALHMTLEIQILALDRHKNVTGLNRLMWIQKIIPQV